MDFLLPCDLTFHMPTLEGSGFIRMTFSFRIPLVLGFALLLALLETMLVALQYTLSSILVNPKVPQASKWEVTSTSQSVQNCFQPFDWLINQLESGVNPDGHSDNYEILTILLFQAYLCQWRFSNDSIVCTKYISKRGTSVSLEWSQACVSTTFQV